MLPKTKQIIQFFEQIKLGHITTESIQELIENGTKIGFRRLLMQTMALARTAAEKVTDAYDQSLAYKAIAEVSKDNGDFQAAREAAEKVTNAYEQSVAYKAIAEALAKNSDFQVAREAAEKVTNTYEQSVAYKAIAEALAKVLA